MSLDHLAQAPLLAGLATAGFAAVATILEGESWSLGCFAWNCFKAVFLTIFILAAAVAGFLGGMCLMSRQRSPEKVNGQSVDWNKWIIFKDASLKEVFGDSRFPMETFVELYLDQKIDFKVDPKEVFENHKNELFRFIFTKEHIRYVLLVLLPQGWSHKPKMDFTEITEVYDRGNDFYRAFLGPMMIYTCGIFKTKDDTLEQAQRNKLDMVCQKLQLQQGDTLLDLGCGWGTLGIHAAKYYGATVHCCTISKEQAEMAKDRAKEAGVADKVSFLIMDYRDIPHMKYDKISCLEMAEHVGVKNFPPFLKQLNGLLKDDGLFYLQIAGLRRQWQYEDLVWGMFMGKYIFPAADASCPLAWDVAHLEDAGFEVASHENNGIQYSWTISRWMDNCLKNKSKMVKAHGEKWYRIWVIFLGWSTMIAKEGGSTVHFILAFKNRSEFDRSRFTPVYQTSRDPSPVVFEKDKAGTY